MYWSIDNYRCWMTLIQNSLSDHATTAAKDDDDYDCDKPVIRASVILMFLLRFIDTCKTKVTLTMATTKLVASFDSVQ